MAFNQLIILAIICILSSEAKDSQPPGGLSVVVAMLDRLSKLDDLRRTPSERLLWRSGRVVDSRDGAAGQRCVYKLKRVFSRIDTVRAPTRPSATRPL